MSCCWSSRDPNHLIIPALYNTIPYGELRGRGNLQPKALGGEIAATRLVVFSSKVLVRSKPNKQLQRTERRSETEKWSEEIDILKRRER